MTDVFQPDRRSLLFSLASVTALPVAASAQVASQGAGLAPRPLDELLDRSLSVLEFIPAELHAEIRAETGRTDLAPYINQAIRHVQDLPGGGALFFPAGAYPVSEIDATNDDPARFSKSVRIVGAGRLATKICAVQPGGTLLNLKGRNGITVESLMLLADRVPMQTAIYLARTAGSPNCNGNSFRDVLVRGSFSVGGVVSIAAESTSWSQCRFENSNNAAHHLCFATSNRPDRLPVRTAHGGAPIASSNTDNVMVDCEFYAPYEGARPVLFDESAGYGMTMCTVLGGNASGARLVTYRPGGETFSGPVTWHNPHFEVFGRDNVIHQLDAPDGVAYFRGINSYSGNYVVESGTTLLGFAGRPPGAQPVLMGSTWTVPMTPWGKFNLAFEVFGLADSAVALRIGDGVGTLRVRGFASNSKFEAAALEVAQVVGGGRC